MSILLRRMKMPAEGWHKVVKIFSDGTVVNHYDSVELGKAVPVQEHGWLLKVLKTERECVSRDCNRDCGKCDLSLEQDEVLLAYDTLIALFADQAEEGET